MTSIPLPPIPLSQAGRAAHDLGLAGLLGGNLFGRLALHPSVTEISDQEERGKLVNASWKRYGTVNSLSLLAVVTGWAGARAAEARDHRLSPEERPLARAKDVLVGLVAVTGVATATTPRSTPRPSRRAASAASTRSAQPASPPRSPSWASTPRSTRRASAARRRAGDSGARSGAGGGRVTCGPS